MSRPVSVLVKHYPGTGRLSGLVGFARVLVPALRRRRNVNVLCGSVEGGSAETDEAVVRLHPKLFWLLVWRRIAPVGGVLVLSGIHVPVLIRALAWILVLSGMQRRDVVFVQTVGLDRGLSASEARSLARACRKVAFLNPFEAARTVQVLHDAVYIRSGVSPELLVAPLKPRPGSPLRIGFLGHLNKVKGADRIPAIIDAMRATGWECVVAGTGDLSVPLTQWAATKAERVRLSGYLEDPIALLRTCDILLAPFRQSNTVLGISQVVLEALALGIPVVGTPSEAISAVVSHGVNGFLHAEDYAMAGALDRLATDHDTWRAFSQEARITASGYSIDDTADALLDLLQPLTTAQTQA